MKPVCVEAHAAACAAHLVLAPGVEGVVDRKRQFQLAMVTELEQVEAFRDGEQPP